MVVLSFFSWLAVIFVIIGGINWGLVGFFNFDLVAAIFGGGNQRATFPRVIYAIVGLATLWMILLLIIARR